MNNTNNGIAERDWTYRSILAELFLSHRALFVFGVLWAEAFLFFGLWQTKFFHSLTKSAGEDYVSALVVLLFIAPVAFLIWYIRDINRTEEVKNTLYDSRLKDFHQIEKWATQIPNAGEESVTQIAAIHQLFPYLKGEMGPHFMRPTFEIYKALLSSWKPEGENERGEYWASVGRQSLPKPPEYIRVVHDVISKELEFFKRAHWDDENLLKDLDLKMIDLSWADLRDVKFRATGKLEGATLRLAKLHGANLMGSSLRSADCTGGKFDSAILYGAHMEGATFATAFLVGAQMHYLHTNGATSLLGAIYDDSTRIPGAVFVRDQGMVHVDTLEKEESGDGSEFDSVSDTISENDTINEGGIIIEDPSYSDDDTIEFQRTDSTPDF